MGFWGSLAGIATSFIPGVGPLLAPIVGGAVNSLTSGGSGGGQSATAANGAAVAATQQAQKSATAGNEAVASGEANLGAAGDSYRTALNGSQEQLQSLLGPEINTVMSQYDNAAKTAATFGPRGGGRTATMGELPFAKAAAAGGLISKARSEAAAGLSDVGGKQSSTGASLTGQLTSQLGPALAPGMQQAGFNNENDKSLGAGIGKIAANIFGNKTPKTPSFDNGSGSNEGISGGNVDIGGAYGGDSGE
jgi:hypothetical protein